VVKFTVPRKFYTLQEMTMAVSAYETKRHLGAQAATALAIGFAG